MSGVQQQVRQFYDQVGWQQLDEGYFQNAHYEDLRPVSAEYIHRCHLRLLRHLKPDGKYFLDAGSGPIQYNEYLAYSNGYAYRVCVDLSIVALQQARQRIGTHGLFVVADVAHLPFRNDVFEGVVSLHTFHHLPLEEHQRAYRELYRVMGRNSTAVVVNGWDTPPLTRILESPLNIRRWIRKTYRALKTKLGLLSQSTVEPKATFVHKNTAHHLKKMLSDEMQVAIFCWRSVSVRFLRTYIHRGLGGRWLLKALFWLEEKNPRFFGENGQYPLIVITKNKPAA